MLVCSTASAVTQVPVLLSPTAGSSSSTPLAVRYELPEAAGTGTARVIFKLGEAPPTVVTLAAAEDTAGQHTVSLATHNLTANTSEVSSAAPADELADGSYEVTLAYQNVALEPVAATTAKAVRLDTVTGSPTLKVPASESSFEGAFAVSYELPEAALAGSVQLKFEGEGPGTSLLVLTNAAAGEQTVKINPAGLLLEAGIQSGPARLAPGVYALRLQYQDALSNPLASSAPIRVTVLAEKCAGGTYSENGRVPCIEATPGPRAATTGPPPAQPGAAAQHPAPRCALGAAAKLPSLGGTGKQAYLLTCNLAGTLSVRGVATITSGRRHIRLTIPPSSVKAVAGSSGRHLLAVKLSKAARRLLRSPRARVGLAISVYAGSAGAAPRLAGIALAGRR